MSHPPLFIIEGLPAVLLGFVALKFLTDRPEQAGWLTKSEREALGAVLAAEADVTREAGYAGLGQALTRPRVLVLGLLYFCIAFGAYGIGFWMPQVIQTFGLTSLKIGFLTAVPYLFAAIAMVIWGWHSDRTGERTWHVALPLLLAAFAFAWSASALPLGLTMIALTLATLGIHGVVGTFWSLPTAILTGTAAAAGIALINSMGNLGGFAAPVIVGVIKQATGSFTAAFLFLAGTLLLGALIALLFGYAARQIASPRARA